MPYVCESKAAVAAARERGGRRVVTAGGKWAIGILGSRQEWRMGEGDQTGEGGGKNASLA